MSFHKVPQDSPPPPPPTINQLPQSFQISETPTKMVVRIRLTPRSIQIISEQLKRFKFTDLFNVGKYNETKYSYNNEQKYVQIQLDRDYYFNALADRKYQTLIFARTYSSTMEDFLNITASITNGYKSFKPGYAELVKLDFFSLTVYRNFETKNYKNQVQIRRVYLRMSPFIFRRNPYARLKQCQQYFSVVIRQYNPNIDKQPIQCPPDQQFYFNQRVNYIDDMYANDSFARRFPLRFTTFHQAQQLFSGNVSMDHKYVRQFYAKVAHRCCFTAMRLKKMSFNFKTNSLAERDKYFKMWLVFNCYDEDSCNFQIQLVPDTQFNEKYQAYQNVQGVSQAFLRHLKQSISPSNPNPDTAYPFVQILPMSSSRSFLGFRIINEIGFCRILCELNFFMDRIIFRNISNKLLNEAHFKQPTMQYKLPVTQQQKNKKYAYNYLLQLKSSFYYANTYKQQKQRYPYQNTLHKITMLRKKVANKENKDNNNQSIQFMASTDQLRGMVCYVNQLIRKVNVSDCYCDVNCFVGSYMNIIVDKNKDRGEKSMFKSVSQWKIVIEGLSALIQSLTKSFNTEDSTIFLYILRTYEDTRKADQLTKLQISEGQQVMLMTFKYCKITSAGWIQIIPTCTYYFEMYKDYTEIYCHKGHQVEKSQQIGIRSSREQIQKVFKNYVKKTINNSKVELPPLQYGTTTTLNL